MKRKISVFTALMLSVLLAACGNDTDYTKSEKASIADVTEESTQPTTEKSTEPATEEVTQPVTEPETEEETTESIQGTMYTDPVYNFNIIIPEEILLTYVSNPIEDDEEGKCQTLLECYPNDNIRIGIEYLERPAYSSAEEYIATVTSALECERGTITSKDGSAGAYFYINFGADIGEESHSMNCLFEIDNTHYINIWYGFTDIKYYETAIKSLESFNWNIMSDVGNFS